MRVAARLTAPGILNRELQLRLNVRISPRDSNGIGVANVTSTRMRFLTG
ncbi:hypothetical protein RB2335 [Rhodopirellula baltica SH 1]|uniref:Uncharacterized protein n=1 Tax=Rhodopirellula baltica (strain DSM 10527 / NCIMB 13988 / SH1) TaxID=243090 RepID=Q7UW10_RHOBA|nr:hypothetical protein RB2335 [Rhodopirellula baltica SH 1]